MSVVGGEDPALAGDAVRGQDGIFLGSVSTTSTFAYPSATIVAWDSFIATATAASASASTSSGTHWTGAAVREAQADGYVWTMGFTLLLSVVLGWA